LKRRLIELFASGVLLGAWITTAAAAGRDSAPHAVRVPATPSVEALENYDLVTLQRVQFSAAGANLNSPDRTALEQIAESLSQRPSAVVELRGYADGAASHKKNESLSLERATAIARFLISRGVAKEHVLVLGLGEVDPAGPQSRPDHQRVDVRVFEPAITKTTVRHETAAGLLLQEMWGATKEP
jgi:outer membrane protein OmpA-like peptidoglycan-associated protein